jgi:purine-nucleoside phosphorylase
VTGSSLYDRVQETANWLNERARETPVVALILGSGLGELADTLPERVALPYEEIPHFPTSSVEGHAGNMVFGEFSGRYVVIMQGRVHYYEGWEPDEITFPIRVFGAMGIERVLITNSAGGINPDFKPGDLMLITDHLNLTGYSPLRGENDDRFGPRFPDMSEAYDPEMRQTIIAAAREMNIPLKSGVYAGMAGPSYETPAEIRMLAKIGGDAVGMSTVPETIVANHMGLKVGGVSCISNLAAGISERKLSHAEVKATANLVRETFASLVQKTVELL